LDLSKEAGNLEGGDKKIAQRTHSKGSFWCLIPLAQFLSQKKSIVKATTKKISGKYGRPRERGQPE